MIRVIVQQADAGMAANVGGPVEITIRTFDVELPALEAHLRESIGWNYTSRRVIGVELLDPKPEVAP